MKFLRYLLGITLLLYSFTTIATPQSTHRYFLALPVPEIVAESLSLEVIKPLTQKTPALKGEHKDSLHITLVFLGELTKPEVEKLISTLSRASFSGFRTMVDAPISLPQTPPHKYLTLKIWMEPELEQLQATLFQLAQSALERDLSQYAYPDYLPHVSLARGKPNATPADFAAAEEILRQNPRYDNWPVTHYTLYEGLPAGSPKRFRVVAEFPMAD